MREYIKTCIKKSVLWKIWKILFALNPTEDIFDYRSILVKRLDNRRTVRCTNRHYGISYILRRYTGYKGIIESACEHGIYLAEGIFNVYEYRDNDLPGLLVPSRDRANFIKNYSNKYILPLGPSVFYAETIYNEVELRVIKSNLGKTLLIFPTHSCQNEYTMFNTKKFIEYVKGIKEEYHYDTVLVCVYFYDMKLGLHIPYEKENWTIVSAGYQDNYDFNDCLKTILHLCDHVINQGFSSNLGYSIYLGKPVTYYQDTIVNVDETEQLFKELSEKIGFSYEEYKTKCDDVEKNLVDLFGDYKEYITKEQYDWCNKIYGYEDIRSKEELKAFFEFVKKQKKHKNSKTLINKYPILKNIVVKSECE